MMIALHKNARTTPATRAEVAASSGTAATLALRYGEKEGAVYKWKVRDSCHDASHTAHRLQTTHTSAQELIVVERLNKRSRCAQNPSIHQWCGFAVKAHASCGFVQPSITPVGAQEQNTDVGHERLDRFANASVGKAPL